MQHLHIEEEAVLSGRSYFEFEDDFGNKAEVAESCPPRSLVRSSLEDSVGCLV